MRRNSVRTLRISQPTLRLRWQSLVATLALVFLLVNTIFLAPEPPSVSDFWRWNTIIVALGLSLWNISSACRAYRLTGVLSVVGFLQAWSFFAFSFPAVEMTYRYSSLTVGYWRTSTNEPLLLEAVILLGFFQILFFWALGREPHEAVNRMALASKVRRPRLGLALAFFFLVIPLGLARIKVMLDLGLRGIVETMITRDGYWERLSLPPSGIEALLNSLFPVYAVSLLCLGIKYLVEHPSAAGKWLYAATLVISCGGAVITGGRAEIVYAVFTVVLFMYVQGYRRITQYSPVVLAVALAGSMLILVAQARHGVGNLLSQVVGGNQAGYDYAAGDITQLLGLGRFDVMVMILDNFSNETLLFGKSYVYALAGGLNAIFLPKLVLGDWIPTWRISDQVLGYWIFGKDVASALPSAPGELLLNFGLAGVAFGAVLLGFAVRLFLRWMTGFRGPIEFAWITIVWIVAHLLSDESFLVATWIKNWLPVLVLTLLLVKRTSAGSGYRRSATNNGIPTSRVLQNRHKNRKTRPVV